MSEEMSEVAARAIEEAEFEVEKLSGREEEPWFRYVALSSTIIAVLCAIGAYFTGAASDRASVERTKEVIRWQSAQSESTSEVIMQAQREILLALGQTPSPKDTEQEGNIEREREENSKGFDQAREKTMELYEAHDLMASGITFFQLSIALGAIAILLRKKKLWLVGVGFGVVACVATVAGYVWFEHIVNELTPLLDVSKQS